jgi:hypothetical protein
LLENTGHRGVRILPVFLPRVSVSRFALHAGLLLFAKHLFFAALVANCLLPRALKDVRPSMKKSDFCRHNLPVRARLRPAPPMPTQCTFRSWARRS